MIPARYHFVWYGRPFPYLNRLAVAATAHHCFPCQIVIWHSDALGGDPNFEAACALPGVSARPLSFESLFGSAAFAAFDVEKLSRIYREVSSHVARSNIARAAILYLEGGVYLDTDVLVVRPFAPLLHRPAFLGTERIVWPCDVEVDPVYRRYIGPLLSTLRTLSGSIPHGERLHLATARLYKTAVNGAIFGAQAGHPLLLRLLEGTAEVPECDWQVKHRLGTHLLQRVVAEYRGNDVTLLDPEVLYPLGPVASRQYFRVRRDARTAALRIVGSRTRAIHWYASVSDVTALGAEELTLLRDRTVIGQLCAPFAELE